MKNCYNNYVNYHDSTLIKEFKFPYYYDSRLKGILKWTDYSIEFVEHIKNYDGNLVLYIFDMDSNDIIDAMININVTINTMDIFNNLEPFKNDMDIWKEMRVIISILKGKNMYNYQCNYSKCFPPENYKDTIYEIIHGNVQYFMDNNPWMFSYIKNDPRLNQELIECLRNNFGLMKHVEPLPEYQMVAMQTFHDFSF